MLQYLKQEANKTFTENGATTYNSTLSDCVESGSRACEYIRDKRKSPPVRFEELLCYLDSSVEKDVLKLLELKMTTSEFSKGRAVPNLNRYIEAKLSEFEEYAKKQPFCQKNDWEELNRLFLEIC